MSHLTDTQKRQIARLLQARESIVRAQVERELDRREAYPELAGDTGDVATVAVLSEVQQTELDREQRELQELANARARIATDVFGLCVTCAEAIPFERLLVQPTTLRCNRCQTALERQQARRR